MDAWDKIEHGLGRDKLEAYVQTVLSLSALDEDTNDLKRSLRKIMSDPQRMVAFRSNLASFIRAYANLDAATLDFGPDSQTINRVVACFQGSHSTTGVHRRCCGLRRPLLREIASASFER